MDKIIVNNQHNLLNRHERRKAAAILLIEQNREIERIKQEAIMERKREGERIKLEKEAEEKLAYLRKRKLPTVGLSIVGQAEKVKRLGLLVSEKAKTVTRKALKPEYKMYKDSIAIEKYLAEADQRELIYKQKQLEKIDILNLIDSMIPPKPISKPQTIFYSKTATTSKATLYSGSSIIVTKINREKQAEFFNNNELIIEELPEII